jgi:hypothetical protein
MAGTVNVGLPVSILLTLDVHPLLYFESRRFLRDT